MAEDDLEIDLDEEPADGSEDGAEVAPMPEYDDGDPNLALTWASNSTGLKALDAIGKEVIRRFDSSKDSTEQYRDEFSKILSYFAGDVPPKKSGFEWSANAHVPIILEGISRIAMRMEAEVFGNWRNVFAVAPVGPDDDQDAQILSKHGNWQIGEKLVDFKRQMSRAIIAFCLAEVTCHSYWDPIRKENCHDTLTPDDFYTPYTFVTTRPDYSDLPYYTRVIRKFSHELQKMRGEWHGVDELLEREPQEDDEPIDDIRERRAETEGIEPDDGGPHPYRILWHEGWFDLPGRTESRWCKALVEYNSMTVLQLTILEEEDWQDRVRFERQQAELNGFRQARAARAQASMAADQAVSDAEMAAAMDPLVAGPQAAAHAAELHAQVPPEPAAPPWMANPEDPEEGPAPPRMVPVYLFAHGVCVEPLVGNLGLSFGHMMRPLQEAANTALSQFIDAATFANVKAFIATSVVDLDKDVVIEPGKIIKIDGIRPGELANNIMPLEFGPANPQLLQLVELFKGYAESAIQSPSVLSGESGKSGETYRGISARIEQATKQLSVGAQKFCEFLKQVLRNNAKLNSIYLADDEIASVLNDMTGQWERIQVGKDLYRRDYRVQIVSDLRFASQAQRIAEADELVALPANFPPLQQALAFQHRALVLALRARGREDMIPYLGPPPPLPTTPFGLQPPPPPGMGMSTDPNQNPGMPSPGAPQVPPS